MGKLFSQEFFTIYKGYIYKKFQQLEVKTQCPLIFQSHIQRSLQVWCVYFHNCYASTKEFLENYTKWDFTTYILLLFCHDTVYYGHLSHYYPNPLGYCFNTSQHVSTVTYLAILIDGIQDLQETFAKTQLLCAKLPCMFIVVTTRKFSFWLVS